MKPTLFIDLDNTLLECGAYYLRASDEAASVIAGATGMSPKAAKDLINAIDNAAVYGPQGFSRDRFPSSFEHAAHVATKIYHGKPDMKIGVMCYDIADGVFTAEYALYDGVQKALTELREAGWQLVIRTKGDPEVQEYKIQKHNLRDYVDHVFISLTKTAAEFEAYITAVGADKATSWSIGDSRKDDIEPALAVGIKAILIDPGSNADWQKQFASDKEPTLHAARFADIVNVLGITYVV
jgi:putative hydrolase of the HAD superfamily